MYRNLQTAWDTPFWLLIRESDKSFFCCISPFHTVSKTEGIVWNFKNILNSCYKRIKALMFHLYLQAVTNCMDQGENYKTGDWGWNSAFSSIWCPSFWFGFLVFFWFLFLENPDTLLCSCMIPPWCFEKNTLIFTHLRLHSCHKIEYLAKVNQLIKTNINELIWIWGLLSVHGQGSDGFGHTETLCAWGFLSFV